MKIIALVALMLPLTAFAQTASSTAQSIDLSGVLFANYQYRGDAGPAKSQNKFDLERVYLTFRMPAGEKGSIRVTTDLFQQTTTGSDSYYKGWILRAKYAYFQYDFLESARWSVLARAGLLQTVIIDHSESFFPRWLSLSPIERAGFFSSADAGISSLVTFPEKRGEFYAVITNGPGYTSRETDRFKDYAARLSLTPLGKSDTRFLKALTLTGWAYRGAIASKFASGGPGQIGAVGSGLHRNRAGIFAGIKDPRLTVGADFATRTDGGETGSNTIASPRAVFDSTGRLFAGYAILHPIHFSDPKDASPLGLVVRWDRFKPNKTAAAFSNVIIGGVTWDLNARASVSLDYQEQTPHFGPAIAESKIYFAHLVANF